MFSHDYTGVMGLEAEYHRVEVPFSSLYIRGYILSTWLITMLIMVIWVISTYFLLCNISIVPFPYSILWK